MLRKAKGKTLWTISVIGVLAVLLISFLFFFDSKSIAKAATLSTATLNSLQIGDVSGFAWMGANINSSNTAEGGGGWLALNCKPSMCPGGSANWGTTVDLTHSGNHGLFSGQAWSSNYGWLSFEGDDVANCYEDNPFVVPHTPATAQIDDGGSEVNVIGWAKFVAGDDDPNDGWDGCVSFNGLNHGVTLDMATGELKGWAWGGDVVGWISFVTPECPFCNTSVVLPGIVGLTFWADNTSVPAGGTTVLHWQATNTGANNVESCDSYGNTSNYPHWKSTGLSGPGNVGVISVTSGKLPTGSHEISGINQTTTYDLTCKDKLGNLLPTQYVTINVNIPIVGCMDPNASNYNPNANVPGRCTYAGATTLDLIVSQPSLVIGSGNYEEILKWTSNNPSVLHACTGSFFKATSFTPATGQSLTGWTGISLPSPDQNNYTAVRDAAAGPNQFATKAAAVFSAASGTHFIFSILCHDSSVGDAPVYDSVDVAMVAGTALCTDPTATNYNQPLPCTYGPPPPPNVTLNLNAAPQTLTVGSGNYGVDLDWASNQPSAFSGNTCTGNVTFNGPTITVPNWSTGNLPLPNFNGRHVDLTPWAQSATAGQQFVFKITCGSSDGTKTDQTVVNMIDPTVSTEPPLVQLWITAPNTNPPDLFHENIPAASGFNPVKLKWQALNTSECRAESFMYDNNTGTTQLGPNSDWSGYNWPVDEIDQSNNVRNLDVSFIGNPSVLHPTIFKITCVPDDPNLACDITGADPLKPCPGASVCLGLDGKPFPACNVSSNGSVPSYQEI